MTHGYSAHRRGFPPITHLVLAVVLAAAFLTPQPAEDSSINTDPTIPAESTVAEIIEVTVGAANEESTEATAETVAEVTAEETTGTANEETVETISETVPEETVEEITVTDPNVLDGSPTEPIISMEEPDLIGGADGDFMYDETFLYYTGFTNEAVPTEPATEDQIKIACVGDSITYGYGIQDWLENNYPTLLQNALGESYHVQNFGVSRSCVQDDSNYPYTIQDDYTQSLAYDADVLVFMMGTNDSKAENWQGKEAFKTALCELLDSYGDVQIVLCTPAACFDSLMYSGDTVDYELRPAVIETIAEIVREVAAERGYPLVDIYALTENNSQLYSIDGVHPNKDGAAVIAEAVFEAVSALNIAE